VPSDKSISAFILLSLPKFSQQVFVTANICLLAEITIVTMTTEWCYIHPTGGGRLKMQDMKMWHSTAGVENARRVKCDKRKI